MTLGTWLLLSKLDEICQFFVYLILKWTRDKTGMKNCPAFALRAMAGTQFSALASLGENWWWEILNEYRTNNSTDFQILANKIKNF